MKQSHARGNILAQSDEENTTGLSNSTNLNQEKKSRKKTTMQDTSSYEVHW